MDIEKILQANQALISGEKRAKFEQFRSLLLEYNQKYNLTSITDERDVFYKHFLDSSAGTGLFQEGASVAEVGSGAGFPSVVLKLCNVPSLLYTASPSSSKPSGICLKSKPTPKVVSVLVSF